MQFGDENFTSLFGLMAREQPFSGCEKDRSALTVRQTCMFIRHLKFYLTQPTRYFSNGLVQPPPGFGWLTILETPAILGLLPDKTGDPKGERKTMMESQHRKVVQDGSCGSLFATCFEHLVVFMS